MLKKILLGLEILGAFLLRVVWQWPMVFRQGIVFFRGTDSWYHLRLIDAMMVNFPRPLIWDAFASYPEGSPSGYNPLMAWIVVAVSKLTNANYEYVAALLPPIAGAFTLIPIYLTGKRLWGHWQGLLAAFLFAIIPSESFFRTLLGAADHHYLEIFFMAWVVYSIVKRTRIGLGVSIGLYLLSWHGGAFIALPILVWYWLEFLLGIKDNKSTLETSKLASFGSLLGLGLSLPATLTSIVRNETLLAMALLIFGPLVLEVVKRVTKNKEMFIFALSIIIPVGFIIFDFVLSFKALLSGAFWGYGSSVQESAPITLQSLFSSFGVMVFLGILGIMFLIKEKGNKFLITWTLVMIAFTIGQVRWTYYLTLGVALLSAYFIGYLGKWVKDNVRAAARVVVTIGTVASIFMNTTLAVRAPDIFTSDWYNSMVWLRYNTPDPFVGEDVYNELSTKKVPSYSVLSWWDYGHWIIRIGHRVPFDSPTYPNAIPSQFFIAKSEEEAEKVIKGQNVKYIIMDRDIIEGKWYAVVNRVSTDLEASWKIRPNSMALRLWENRASGYKLVHQEGDVKIFEKLSP